MGCTYLGGPAGEVQDTATQSSLAAHNDTHAERFLEWGMTGSSLHRLPQGMSDQSVLFSTEYALDAHTRQEVTFMLAL